MEKALMTYQLHLHTSTDLITSHEATRAGFIDLALERNQRANPLIEQARALRIRASEAATPRDLLRFSDIRSALITASALSDKSLNYLTESDKTSAIEELIKNFLEPAGEHFIEELVYRFLLTRGDTLGGIMRNIGGVIGERKLARSLISALQITETSYYWLDNSSSRKIWHPQPEDDFQIENRVRGLSWSYENNHRTFLYNLKVPIVRKNIDICLFNLPHTQIETETYRNPSAYVALGELKAGIDPAGADEHWKTANSALGRIREAFKESGQMPHTFFIAAAIVENMASEIWKQLQSDVMQNVANLNNPEQVASICRWFVTL